MALVIVVAGPNNGDYHPLGAAPVVFGRDGQCDLQIVDPRVSRRHCRFEYDADTGTAKAIHLGSKNGMRVNDQPVAEARLQDGDVVHIGDTLLLYSARDVADLDGAVNRFRTRRAAKNVTVSHEIFFTDLE